MIISDLSSEQKVKLSEKYKELDNIVRQKEELDTKIVPLCDKLSELEMEEAKLNEEYNEIFVSNKEGFTSKETERLADITNRNVELSNEKEKIKSEINDLSKDFFDIRKEEDSLKEYIQAIVENKEGSIFSVDDEVVKLDEEGNIVNKVVVDSSSFSNIKESEQYINSSKNTITRTSTKVLDVIRNNYKKVDKVSYNLSSNIQEKISNFIEKVESKVMEIVDEVKKGYQEEEQRIQSIIDDYNKKKEEKEKIEEEANNLQFACNIEDNKLINENLNSDNLEEPNITLLSNGMKEIDNLESVNLNEMVTVIDNKDIEVKEEQINIENNKDIISYSEKEQFSEVKNNKIAKSNANKLINMITLFKEGKNSEKEIANVVDDKIENDTEETKRGSLKKVKKYKKKNVENNYDTQIDELENIFAGKSIA